MDSGLSYCLEDLPMGQRKKYSVEFKVEAVRMVTEQGMSLREVAHDLGIDRTMLRRWKQKFEEEGTPSFPGNGKLSPEQEEIRRLQEENRQLRMERDILKKATAFFAGQNK